MDLQCYMVGALWTSVAFAAESGQQGEDCEHERGAPSADVGQPRSIVVFLHRAEADGRIDI
jgi:hypothetical protein